MSFANKSPKDSGSKISVLMSLYCKEKPEYFKEATKSILAQTVAPDEIVIVEDGPLTEELYVSIAEFQERYPSLFKVVSLKKNVGLGLALRHGVEACSNELIARMDTDDISVPNRFEVQLNEFMKDDDLSVCGSHIQEFVDDPSLVQGCRKVPLADADIRRYQKRRDGVNHVTVMYRRSDVLKSGNYSHAPLMEDSYLWVKMMLAGCKFKNVDDYLVLVRADKDMIKRRGGLSYFKKYCEGRKMIYKTGFIGFSDYIQTVIAQMVICAMPLSLRTFVFRALLRSGH